MYFFFVYSVFCICLLFTHRMILYLLFVYVLRPFPPSLLSLFHFAQYLILSLFVYFVFFFFFIVVYVLCQLLKNTSSISLFLAQWIQYALYFLYSRLFTVFSVCLFVCFSGSMCLPFVCIDCQLVIILSPFLFFHGQTDSLCIFFLLLFAYCYHCLCTFLDVCLFTLCLRTLSSPHNTSSRSLFSLPNEVFMHYICLYSRLFTVFSACFPRCMFVYPFVYVDSQVVMILSLPLFS